MLSYRGLSGSSWQGACYVHKDFSHQHIVCLHSAITSRHDTGQNRGHRGKLGLMWKSCLKKSWFRLCGKNIPTKLTSKFCYPALLGFMSRPTEGVVGICYTSIHFITDFDTLILLQHVAQWVESSAYMWICHDTGDYRSLTWETWMAIFCFGTAWKLAQ